MIINQGMVRKILTLFCIVLCYKGTAGQVTADSLYSGYKNATNDSIRTVFLNRLGRYYFFKNTDSSAYFLSRAISESKKLNYPFVKSYTYLCVGDFYSITGDPTSGIDAYLDGLRIAEDNGIDRIRPSFLNNLGITYSQIGQYDQAIKYTKKGLGYYIQIDHKEYQSNAYNNIGSNFTDIGSPDSARKYLNAALALKREEKLYLGSVFENLAYHFFHTSNYDSSIYYYNQSLQQQHAYGYVRKLGQVYLGLGSVYSANSMPDSAMYFVRKAFDEAQRLNLTQLSVNSAEVLTELLFEDNQIKEAYDVLKIQNQYLDSIANEVQNRVARGREFRFEQEKKELEDEILVKEALFSQQLNMVLTALLASIVVLLFLLFKRYQSNRSVQKILEVRIADKTAQLNAKNARLERYAFEISHTIKAPMTTILGIINLINYEKSEERKNQCLKLLEEESAKINQILSDTLTGIEEENDKRNKY